MEGKMDCYHFSQKFAFVKSITYNLWTHDSKTGIETLDTITAEEPPIETRDYEVVMVKAIVYGRFEVTGFRTV